MSGGRKSESHDVRVKSKALHDVTLSGGDEGCSDFPADDATGPADLWAATSRANRALTLLKQACDDARHQSGRV